MQSILAQLALTDPSAAQTYIGQMADGPLRDQAITQVALNEADSNPQDTLSWLQNISGTSTPSSAVMSQMIEIVNDMASVDPQATANYVESMQGKPAFNRLVGQLGMNWASVDSQGALTWAESLPANGGYSNAIQGVAAAIAIENPQLAWNDVAAQMPPGEAQTQTMAVVAIKWAAQDPAQAAQATGIYSHRLFVELRHDERGQKLVGHGPDGGFCLGQHAAGGRCPRRSRRANYK